MSVDGRCELLVAERDERVVAAAKHAPCDLDRGAVVAETRLEPAVVVAVGRGVPGGGLRGLVERPPKKRRALARDVAGLSLVGRLRDGDVEPRETHELARAREAPGVADLGVDRDRDHGADAEVTLKRLAGWL